KGRPGIGIALLCAINQGGPMQMTRRITRITAAAAALVAVGACANTGGLGSVLSSVLGGTGGQQLAGTVRSVDTRNSQISVQQPQGNVRSIDRTNGKFTIDAGSNVLLTVSMPYRANSTDANKFNNLRLGDYVRFSGVYLNNSLVELRQFY